MTKHWSETHNRYEVSLKWDMNDIFVPRFVEEISPATPVHVMFILKGENPAHLWWSDKPVSALFIREGKL
jgi:hypothetical protein